MWSKHPLEWTDNKTAYLSTVFTWQLPDAWSRCVWYRQQGYNVVAGGVAVSLMPDYLKSVADISQKIPCLTRHNPDATRFSTGCINKCSFCGVPITEGDFKECEGEPKPIVCDNNYLASTRKHFDYGIDTLKGVKGVDMNQGLDCRLITPYHVGRLKELDLACIRFAWDNVNSESKVIDAINMCIKGGIPKSKIRLYVLVGFNDTPEDALYRMQTLKAMGLNKNAPMRYQPIKGEKALVKDSYLSPKWTDYEMVRFVRYWFKQAWVGNIPYAEFRG